MKLKKKVKTMTMNDTDVSTKREVSFLQRLVPSIIVFSVIELIAIYKLFFRSSTERRIRYNEDKEIVYLLNERAITAWSFFSDLIIALGFVPLGLALMCFIFSGVVLKEKDELID